MLKSRYLLRLTAVAMTLLGLACSSSGAIEGPGGSGGKPTASSKINAENAAHLKPIARDVPAATQVLKEGNIRAVRWQADSTRAVLASRTGVYEVKNEPEAKTTTVLKVEVGERILDMWPTGGANNHGFYVTLTDNDTYNVRDLDG